MALKLQNWNPLKLIKRSELVRVMILSMNASKFKFGWLIKEGDFVRDPAKDIVYGPLRLRPLFDRKGNPTFMMHSETGAPLGVDKFSYEEVIVDPMDGWSATPLYDDDGRVTFAFDEDTGYPVKVILHEKVLTLTTDPELMGTLTAKTMLANLINRKPDMLIIILVALAMLFMGYSMGVSMSG